MSCSSTRVASCAALALGVTAGPMAPEPPVPLAVDLRVDVPAAVGSVKTSFCRFRACIGGRESLG